MTRHDRPLSPHISIYRLMYTMVLSISHRITGVFLSIGLIVLAYWLAALASGHDSYASAIAMLNTIFFKLLLLGWLFSFFFHLVNGIRHLAWDCGYGFEPAQARASGWLVAVTAIVLTALSVIAIWNAAGGSL